jgi:RNA polymerase sigma factor (sigma-70 family)
MVHELVRCCRLLLYPVGVVNRGRLDALIEVDLGMSPSEFESSDEATSRPQGLFATTHWSVVVNAAELGSPGASEALEKLCRTYWYPLYAYVRRAGYSSEDAQDLTQDFFAHLLAKGYLSLANRSRGKFRSFLLTSLKHHLANEYHHRTRAKRGGGAQLVWLDGLSAEARFAAEPTETNNPETLYERRWALTLLETSLCRLREEYQAQGRAAVFQALKDYVWGEKNSATYAEIAAQLGLTEEAVKKVVQRLRLRLRVLLRAEIAQTVTVLGDVEGELRHLAQLLRQ